MSDSADYSELTVQLRPLARTLEEQLNLREWSAAAHTAQQLNDVVHDLVLYAIREDVRYVWEKKSALCNSTASAQQKNHRAERNGAVEVSKDLRDAQRVSGWIV